MGVKNNLRVILFLFLFSLFLNLVSASTVTYDASDTSTFKGYYDSSLNDPLPPTNTLPPDGATEFNAGEYANIASSDNSRESTSIGDNLEGYIFFNASISAGVVSSITWTWEGYYNDASSPPDNTGTAHFYVWNFTGTSWDECTTNVTDGSSDVTRTCSITTSVTDYYDADYDLYLMVYGTDPDDVSDSFQNTIYTDYVKVQVDAITAQQDSPANNLVTNDVTQTFICNGSDSSLSNITLYLYNSTGVNFYTNVSEATGSTNQTSHDYTFTYDDVYSWNCLLKTVSGSSVFAGTNYTLTIDTVNPGISIATPTDLTNSTDTGLDVNYTVSDSVGVGSCSCWWSNNSGANNYSLASCTTNLTSQTWPEGSNTIIIYVNDTAGNENSSSVTFTIDTTAPSLSIAHPTDLQEFNYNTSIDVNYTVSDSLLEVDTCLLSIDGGANTTLASCANTSINVSDGGHDLTICANDTLNNLACSDVSFTVSLDAPAITLNYPTNGTYHNNGTNFYLNYTATDSNGISVCQIYHNINGSFSLNETNTGVTSAQQNYTTYDITSDGIYLWNVWCNDTTGQARFSSTNRTFIIDETDPYVNITNIGTNEGSQTIFFNHTITETNPSSCKYSILNSSGGIDGLYNNVTLTCGANDTSATVSGYSTYTLRIYSLDLAGNENYTDENFTTTASSPSSDDGGGGGAGEDVEKIPVVGVQGINGTRDYSLLEQEVVFARINDYCAVKEDASDAPTFAIRDYSGECSLTLNDLKEIQFDINEDGFNVPQEDLLLFFNKYADKELLQGYETSEVIEKYRLFTSVLGITNPMKITPPSLDRFFLINSKSGPVNITYTFLVNKNIRECSVINGEDLSCEILTNTTFRVTQYVNDTNFFNKIFDGSVSITSQAGEKNIEVKIVPVVMRAYNIQGNVFGIPAWIFFPGVGIIVLFILILLFSGGKISKKWRKKIRGKA